MHNQAPCCHHLQYKMQEVLLRVFSTVEISKLFLSLWLNARKVRNLDFHRNCIFETFFFSLLYLYAKCAKKAIFQNWNLEPDFRQRTCLKWTWNGRKFSTLCSSHRRILVHCPRRSNNFPLRQKPSFIFFRVKSSQAVSGLSFPLRDLSLFAAVFFSQNDW